MGVPSSGEYISVRNINIELTLSAAPKQMFVD